METAATRQVKTVCPYCGVGCGLILRVEGGRVVGVSGDKSHPANFGALCTKGSTVHETLHVPGRLNYAQRRREGGRFGEFERVPVDFALDAVADGLRKIIAQHGPDAVAFYVSGQLSTETQYVANKLVKGFLGTNNIDSNSRLCMASAAAGYKSSLGADAPPGHYEDFEHTDLFFVIGANPAECHPILHQRLRRRMKSGGAKLLVADPRRTASAADATLHLPLRPGTDLALLNGLLHLLRAAGRVDEDFIARHTDGWPALSALLDDFPPERVSALCDLRIEDLRHAAALLAEAPEFLTLWTQGICQSTRGTWSTNAICNLHLALGKIGRPGSGPFSLTGQPNAMGGREVGYMSGGLPGQRHVNDARDRAETEALWSLPAGAINPTPGLAAVDLFKALESGAVKALWVIGSNPLATMPNRERVRRGLERAELVVVQDAYHPTETSRYAHVLLPGALWAEADGTMVNSSRMVTLAPRAVPPPADALPDWQLVCEVARRLGFGEAFAFRSAAEIFAEISRSHNPRTGYDLRGMSHARLAADGALTWPLAPEPGAAETKRRYLADEGAGAALRFPTANGRAQFQARPWLPDPKMPDDAFPFVLTTGRLAHQWHTRTKTGKVPSLNKLNPGPFLELHPADAADLGAAAGDRVRVVSRRGAAELPVRLTSDIRRGCCWATMHWGELFAPGVAINSVTSEAVDPVSLQPELKFCPVRLELIRPAHSEPAAPAARSPFAGATL